MHAPRYRALWLPVVLALLHAAPAAAQRIDRVEPPNWWVGMRTNAVQLMVHGEDLHGATARFDDPRLEVTAARTLESGSYLFVDVVVPEDLEPGAYSLAVRRGAWGASLDFPILARVHDPARHRGFSSDDVFYLVTPDRFANGSPANDCVAALDECADRSRAGARHGGDLEGVIRHLDYLADLGVTALWLNPVLENAGRASYHGYAATDLYRIDPRLGTNADYRRLVDEAHARGLKVVFDHVNNHIGIRHPWVDDPPRASWLNGTREDHLRGQHFKLSLWDAWGDPATVDRLTRFWFTDSMPDLDQRDPYIARWLIQNTIWWIEYAGLDGIREDTYPYPDQAFMRDWVRAVLDEYPGFNIVGEIWEPPSAYLAAWQAGSPVPGALDTGLPTVMDFALAEAMRSYMAGEAGLSGIYAVLAHDILYADPSRLLTFFDNHDMSRGYLVSGDDPRRAQQMLAILLTTRGIPQLLYGTELGMVAGESHVELRADFPGGFPGDGRSAFAREGRTEGENEAFDLTRALLHLRSRHSALRTGELVHWPPTWGDDVYRFVRRDADATILVLVSGDDGDREVSLDLLAHRLPGGAAFRDLLTGERIVPSPGDGIPVAALGFRILLVE
jgi:glycosidase